MSSIQPRAHTLIECLSRPDIQRIYMHDPTAVDLPTFNRHHGPGRFTFADRALTMAQPGDIVLVSRPVPSSYFQYLEEAGLGPVPEHVLVVSESEGVGLTQYLSSNTGRLVDIAALFQPGKRPVLSPYFCTPQTEIIADFLSELSACPVSIDSGSPESSEHANNKAHMREIADQLGIPQPPGEAVDVVGGDYGPLHQAVERHLELTGKVIVKASLSSSGLDNIILDSAELPEHWLQQRAHVTSFVVESLLPFSGSPNVQVWIAEDGSWSIHDTTNQCLDQTLTHTGNEFPPKLQSGNLTDTVTRLTAALAEQGVRGPVGYDFIEQEGAHCPYFIEVNARCNGSHYASAIRDRVNLTRQTAGLPPLGCYRSLKNISRQSTDFDSFRKALEPLLYKKTGGCGVIPYNPSGLAYGMISAICIGPDTESVSRIEARFMEKTGEFN